MKHPARKLSKNLANRTKLTPEQFERVKGQASGGRASVYDENGEQSLVLTRRLHAMKRKARKFVLVDTSLCPRPLYVSKNVDDGVTFQKDEALHFFEGFDDPSAKLSYYGERFKLLKLFTKSI